MDDQKKQIIDKLKQANNVLVTVRSDPTIDQLAACIGLTLVLNELGKHATAVFSGEVPSVLEFLQPEKTLETNTDSLRDFIIALDKSKADKLRYKVEDKVVKIFITPYKTSISDQDLEFSQGDFNVDVVVALGVHDQSQLDAAITEHGRILHDATVMSVTTDEGEKLGTVNWSDMEVSSLSEMIASIADQLGKKDILDNQIATALLTGIVSETERFSNNKTTPQTMSVSAKLLTAGANQELVASKLAEPMPEPARPESFDEGDTQSSDGGAPKSPAPESPRSSDGMLSIDHSNDEAPEPDTPPADEAPKIDHDETDPTAAAASAHETQSIELPRAEAPQTPPAPAGLPADEQAALDLLKDRQIHVDEHGVLQPIETEHRDFLGEDDHPLLETTPPTPEPEENPAGAPFDLSKFALTPPTMGGTLTANSRPEGFEPSTDPLSTADGRPQILSHERPGANADEAGQKPASQMSVAPARTAPVSESPAQPSVPAAGPSQSAAPTPPVEAPRASAPAPENSVPEPLIAPAFAAPTSAVPTADQPAPKTLAEIEKEVHSPHAGQIPETAPAPETPSPADFAPTASEAHPGLQAALQDAQTTQEVASAEPAPEPLTTPGGELQAQPLSAVEMTPPAAPAPSQPEVPTPATNPADAPELQAQTLDMPLPPTVNIPPVNPNPPTSSPTASPTAPPPVPPPLTPDFMKPHQ